VWRAPHQSKLCKIYQFCSKNACFCAFSKNEVVLGVLVLVLKEGGFLNTLAKRHYREVFTFL